MALTSSSTGGSFLGSGAVITSVLVPAGSSSVNLAYKDTQVGSPVISASAAGLVSATQTETITATAVAAQLAFTTAPINLGVGSTSGVITVVLEDLNGNAVNATAAGVSVALASTSGTGVFKSTGGATITGVTIAAGSSTASFKYVDTVSGTPTLTASATGLAVSSQQETLTSTLTSIAFTTPAHTLILGAGPASVTIELDDQLGSPVVAGAGGALVTLGTTSSGGTFYDSNNNVLTSVTIPAGSSSVTVAYRDTQLGTPTFTATVSGVPAVTQQQTVSPLPTGTVAYYNFGSSAGLLTDSSGFGNTLKLGGGTVAFTGSNVPAGFTGAASFSGGGYLVTNSNAFPTGVPTGTSSYTIAAWIDINNANKNGIVGWGNFGTGGTVNAFRTTQGDAAPNGAGLDNYWWANDYVQSTVNLVNNWAYVAVTYNGTLRSMYVNGVLVGTFTSGAPNTAVTNFKIGVTNGLTEFFNGSMSNLLIANTALSAAQLRNLYNGT